MAGSITSRVPPFGTLQVPVNTLPFHAFSAAIVTAVVSPLDMKIVSLRLDWIPLPACAPR